MTTNNKLARAVATIVPDEALAKVDVYKEKAKGVVNSIQDQLSEYGIDINAFIRGGKKAAQSLPSIVSAAGGLSKGSIVERLAASSSLSKSVFGALPTSLQEGAGKYLQNVSDLTVSVGGVLRLADSTDFTNVKSVGQLVNRVYGSDIIGFEDTNSKASLMIGIIDDCQRNGIGSVFTQLTEDLTGDALNIVSSECVKLGVERGDFKLLGEITDKVGGSFVHASYPNVTQDFISTYERKDTLVPEPSEEVYSEAMRIFNEINSDWLYADRPATYTDTVLDGHTFAKGSEDFNDLVINNAFGTTDEPVSDVALLAVTNVLKYVPTPHESVREQFPMLILTTA